jgi:Tfp pilus assembly PilM family ATPase
MSTRATLPLGIDVGAVRTRVALAERDAGGRPRLVAVATRPTGEDAGAAIADARSELRSRERRCVLALAAPDAVLRTLSFPPMGRTERERAARFEAARFVAYSPHEATVRLMAAADGTYALGIAHRAALERRTTAARRAGLRPIAVDDAAFALARAFPYAGAIVDAGASATRLVVPGEPIPAVRHLSIGGSAITAAIVASLGLSGSDAEARKHSVGLAGAGEHARDALVDELSALLVEQRAASRAEIRTIALAGNGARLAGLGAALERAVAIPVRLAALAADACDALPADVVRAASPDWGLAYGLALWDDAA